MTYGFRPGMVSLRLAFGATLIADSVSLNAFLKLSRSTFAPVSGPPSRPAPSASCCAPALNNSLVSGSLSQAIACASGKCATTRHLWTSLTREALPSRATIWEEPLR